MIPTAHIRLALLAGAAGDCIGGPYETKPSQPHAQVPASPWRLSDDTALTLATCRAIATARGIDPAAIADEFARTYRAGQMRGLGSSTTRALRALAEGSHWALAGHAGERAAGNGAAMRILPLAFFLSGESPEERQLIRDVCRITHRNDEAYAAALAIIRAAHRLNRDDRGAALLENVAGDLPDTLVADRLRLLGALGSAASIPSAIDTVGTSGHAAASVPLAIFLAAHLRSCEDVILAAVRAGGDTDTIASMAAQLLGAAGNELPVSWIYRIPRRDVIESCSAALADLA